MKKWLYDHFLPMWAKETLLWDNRRLEREKQAIEQKNRELEAYIEGMQTGLRAVKRINIINGGGKA